MSQTNPNLPLKTALESPGACDDGINRFVVTWSPQIPVYGTPEAEYHPINNGQDIGAIIDELVADQDVMAFSIAQACIRHPDDLEIEEPRTYRIENIQTAVIVHEHTKRRKVRLRKAFMTRKLLTGMTTAELVHPADEEEPALDPVMFLAPDASQKARGYMPKKGKVILGRNSDIYVGLDSLTMVVRER